ncbi:protein kinase subdomain-containing protein PKL/ccin3 [Coprinopsis sp. MPI-PUGE-AT-0042]|nr:protein kinase subdomain-containing protein PKL/ccin3 [Coprinopsis sp. MPI-PUGE-AT-0042]
MADSTPLLFSTLVINDCRHPSGSSLSLKPTLSFPAPPYTLEDQDKPLPASRVPKDPSRAEGCLELRLLDFIAEGRISTVYAATVVSATHQGIDITSTMPKKVCIKFAKKHSCRSLARDAWFYEQLQDWQGIMTPQSFGFYTSTADEQPDSPKSFTNDFIPWQNHRVHVRYDPYVASWGISMDWVPDDQPSAKIDYIDAGGIKTSSHWYHWAVNDANPVIAVQVMELLGDPCEKIWKKKEILEVVDDMNHVGVYHSDLSAWNVLEANHDNQDTTRLCPRHKTVHRWRIIDFDRASVVNRANTTSTG